MRYDPTKKFLDKIELQLDMLMEDEDNAAKQPDCFLSPEQMSEHYDKHYKEYLDAYKKAKRELDSVSVANADSNGGEYRSACLDINFNYNAVLLHEIYFDCLGKKDMSKKFEEIINKFFRSKEDFFAILKATCIASRGWAIVGLDLLDNSLNVSLVDSHNNQSPMWYPILALDMFEHSYYIDYKSDKQEYIDNLLRDIDWEAVEKRYEKL
tara:strand:+ start:23164 stop:23793 length:630 start_codon:yes stop_codon:yes gene_type:complete